MLGETLRLFVSNWCLSIEFVTIVTAPSLLRRVKDPTLSAPPVVIEIAMARHGLA